MTEEIESVPFVPTPKEVGLGYPKITPDQLKEIIERYKDGALQNELAKDYGVTVQTIRKHLGRAKVLRPTSAEIKEQREEALAEASALPTTIALTPETPACSPLPKISCLDIEQTFQENLAWAIQSAGLLLRTKQKPTECPNDTAFFLYQQACEDPKGFLGRFAQIEGKMSGEKDNELEKESKRSVAEIEEQLQALDEVKKPEVKESEVEEHDPNQDLLEDEFLFEGRFDSKNFFNR